MKNLNLELPSADNNFCDTKHTFNAGITGDITVYAHSAPTGESIMVADSKRNLLGYYFSKTFRSITVNEGFSMIVKRPVDWSFFKKISSWKFENLKQLWNSSLKLSCKQSMNSAN